MKKAPARLVFRLLGPCLLALLAILPAQAQTPLTLADCLELGRRQNLQFLGDRYALDRSQNQLRQAQAPFNLQADAALDLPSFNERSGIVEATGFTSRFRSEDTDFSYGSTLTLSKNLPHIGQLSVISEAQRRDFTSNRSEDFVDFNGQVRVNYQKQILTRPQAEISLEQNQLSHRNARANFSRQELQLESRIVNAYYNLVRSIRQLDIAEQRLSQSKASLELAQRKFEIGLIAEVEALRLQVSQHEAEANFAQSQTNIERSRDLLRAALGMDFDEPLEVATEVNYQPFAIDPDRAEATALQRRTDLQEAQVQESINQLGLESTKQRNGPVATLNANVGIRGQGAELEDISSTLERNTWNVSIAVNLPLIDGGTRRSDISQARIAVEQSRLNQKNIRQEVIRQTKDAVRNLAEGERQIQLRQAALEVAKRTYAVEQSRFELGLADSQALLQAQSDLTSASINALNTFIDYQLLINDLRLATMADLSELAPTGP